MACLCQRAFSFFVLTVQVIVGVLLGRSSNSIYYAQCFFCIGIPSLFLATRKIDYDILRHTVLIVAIGSISHFISILSSEVAIWAREKTQHKYR